MSNYLFYGSERYTQAIMRPISTAIKARGDQVAWFFNGPGMEDLHADDIIFTRVEQVLNWNPIAVITPNNMVPHFFPGIKVQTFHGFDAGKPRHIYIRGFFDLYCTTGPKDTSRFVTLANRLKHFHVVETGWPKLDYFFSQLPTQIPPVKSPPRILYHSTFSPSWSAAEILYPEVKRLSQTGEWKWIVTLHPKMNKETRSKFKDLENENLTFSETDNILELFTEADLMCSDTSSALSEFLLTGKPVITFKNRRPGPQLIDIQKPEDFEPAIRKALTRPSELMNAIARFGAEIHPARDGKSAERVLDAINDFIIKGGKNPKNKPLNLWRKFKLRLAMGYWKFN
ncbi:MAG: CDP-glycerol glycerophosphotransferase family protein [Cellvibrio sp.]|jgi:CDP-glycerol glycerophosphotransferase (TagB/SpsB family)|nr:CDP-glycerol glycerophosphotransferase family protein [Cellvibrio sp.]